MSVFQQLLAIKTFREGQAESAVRLQHQALADAVAAHAAAEQRLAQLLREGAQIEQALYRDLCARVVRLREIENVQLSVASLRQREAAQQDAVQASERLQQEQNQKLDAARVRHQDAARQKSKFVDLARNYADGLLREAERREDLEMEEVASMVRDREDWQGNDVQH